MKKFTLYAAIFFALLWGLALSMETTGFAQDKGGFAGHTAGKGGFTGPGPAVVTVKQALGMRDDSRVTLRGSIIQHLGKDKYLFRDDTGTITVEIDDDEWNGQIVGPEDVVEIFGEVDKDWNSVEIDVKRILKK